MDSETKSDGRRHDWIGAILRNTRLSDDSWSRWVITNDGEPARRNHDFLEICFRNVPAARKQRLINRLRSGDEPQVEAIIHELVAHELLLRLKLEPELEPSLNDLTPDLSFRVADQSFLADVIVVHSPAKTIRDEDGAGEAWDTNEPSESRAKKIAEIIATKSNKYKGLSHPLVVLAFHGDHRILSVHNFEQALFGRTTGEADPGEFFPEVGRAPILLGGLLLPRDDGTMPHRNLSAVAVLDWFDTLNRSDPGKRLHCVVLHHWDPIIPLAANALEPFFQVAWERRGPNAWAYQWLGDGRLVAKFEGRHDLHFRTYSPNQPW